MRSGHYQNSRGFTLVELSVALLVFLIGVLGLLQLMVLGVSINQRSRDTTIVTSLAQGKADELLSRNFSTLTQGGVIPTDPNSDPFTPAPQTCYVDYFNYDGDPLVASGTCGTSTPPDGTYFVRVWQIFAVTGTTNLLGITVTVTAQSSFLRISRPAASVVVYKSRIG